VLLYSIKINYVIREARGVYHPDRMKIFTSIEERYRIENKYYGYIHSKDDREKPLDWQLLKSPGHSGIRNGENSGHALGDGSRFAYCTLEFASGLENSD
jgi:hypothetical protein